MKILFLLLLFTSTALMVVGQKKPSDPLEQFRWKNRLVLIVSNDQKIIDQQVSVYESADKEEWQDRKLKWIVISTGGYRITGEKWVNEKSLYQKYNSKENNNKCLLVGLDGGIKKEWKRVTTPSEIYELIDKMPMRQIETKQ